MGTWMTLLSCIATVLLTVKAQQLTSPCPDVFTYEPRGSDPDRWHGNVLLTTDVELNGVYLDVVLDRPSQLLGNWFGEVTSSDNKVYTIINRTQKLRPGPTATSVRIFVKYSEVEQIPIVETIRLNGRTICDKSHQTSSSGHRQSTRAPDQPTKLQTSGIDSTTRRTTTRRIQSQSSSLGNSNTNNNNRPAPNANSYNGNGGDPNSVSTVNSRPTYSNNDDNQNHNQNHNQNQYPTTRRTTTTQFSWVTVAPPVKNNENSDEGYDGDFFRPGKRPIITPARPLSSSNNQCGTVAAQAKPLITHGQQTSEGQWPWHAALYQSKGIDLSYICGASLVSSRYVITAAHCVTRKQSERPVSPESLMVYLGKFNLRKWSSTGIQDIQVSDIIISPEYNSSNFDSDVAILKLRSDARITDYVRPVCLWDDNTDLNSVLDREGTVVGWGYDETGRVTEELTMTRMPVVSQQTCIWSYPEFFSRFTSSKTYCAGFRNGTSVCNGDSGGGMVFPRSNTNPTVWQLRGLVSISVALQNEFVCDASHYVVFTDLAKHLSWIESTING